VIRTLYEENISFSLKGREEYKWFLWTNKNWRWVLHCFKGRPTTGFTNLEWKDDGNPAYFVTADLSS